MPQIHSAGFATRHARRPVAWVPLADLEEIDMGQLDREQMQEDRERCLDEYEGAREALAALEKNITQPDPVVAKRKEALLAKMVVAADQLNRINQALLRPRP